MSKKLPPGTRIPNQMQRRLARLRGHLQLIHLYSGVSYDVKGGFFGVLKEFTAYKSVRIFNTRTHYVVDKKTIALTIPAGAVVHVSNSPGGAKMRATVALVQDFRLPKNKHVKLVSIHNYDYEYTPGGIMLPLNLAPSNKAFFVRKTCAPGIHFFLTRNAARNYNY